jgi:hypothetical protein
MCSAVGDRVSPRPGCPIRISSDLRLPATPRGVSSPGHVLLRPQTPRHPPCALHAADSPPVPGSPVVPHRRLRNGTPQPPASSSPTHFNAPQAGLGDHLRHVSCIASRMVLPCSPLLRYTGGAEGIRTPDLRRAKAALSRLSYSPIWKTTCGRSWTRTTGLTLIRGVLSPTELNARPGTLAVEA